MKIPLSRSLILGALFATTPNLFVRNATAQTRKPTAPLTGGAYSQAVALPAPGVAPISPAEIQPTDTEAWQARDVREKRAAAVMTPQAAAQQAQELAVFNETVKRLADVEKTDPARALAEYRRFLVGKNPSAVVGVQAAIKVSQLRQSTNDANGATLVCDVMARKYGSEPSSVLLLLQKLTVLTDQKRWSDAAQNIKQAMPEFLAAGPQYYGPISDALLKFQSEDSENNLVSQADSSSLYVDVEQIYLSWLKNGTIPHTWQLFDGLRERYREIGDEKREKEILPKVVDTLLQIAPTSKNVEIADTSLMATRWLESQGRFEDADKLRSMVNNYGNDYVSQVANIDQALSLSFQNRYDEALKIASLPQENPMVQTALLSLKGHIYYQLGDMDEAEKWNKIALDRSISLNQTNPEIGGYLESSRSCIEWIGRWKESPIVVDRNELNVSGNQNNSENVTIRTLKPDPLEVTSDDPTIKATIGQNEFSSRTGPFSHYCEKKLVVEVAPRKDEVSHTALLTISSPKYPDQKVQIQVKVKVKDIIQKSCDSIFFGTVNNGNNSRKIWLKSDHEFQVKSIESTNADFVGSGIGDDKPSLTHEIGVTFISRAGSGLKQGMIRVLTDSPKLSVIEIPCSAFIK